MQTRECLIRVAEGANKFLVLEFDSQIMYPLKVL